MRIFILGGTGFIGTHLCKYLSDNGHKVLVLTRSRKKESILPHQVQTVIGDPLEPGEWQKTAGQSEVIVNLAGKNMFARWTEQIKQEIMDSRILSTRMAVQAIENAEGNKPCLMNANAVGYYPDQGDKILTEKDPPGENFLSKVCVKWQEEALRGQQFGARIVVGRFAPVLGKGGGVLSQMLTPFRLGLGGRIGSGKQGFPWIHIQDLLRAIEFVIKNEQIHGPVNMCAPQTINNAQFTKALAKTLRRPAIFPIPEFALRIIYGELAQMLVRGPFVSPKVLDDNGFSFHFPSVRQALEDLLQ